MPDGLRIVLFGTPGAGKTSLVGALAHAGQTQSAELGGQLVGATEEMTALKNAIYQKGPAKTHDEIKDYPVTIEAPGAKPGASTTATLTDCSGETAQALMRTGESLPKNSRLAKALLDADALVFLVDASGTLDHDVAAMGEFLHLFQSVRGQRADIAGLPVYLVLSKCDLIAKPSDTYNQWVQRIEEGKRKLAQRFQAMLDNQAGLPFGRVDLHLWATAVKRPALTDRPAKNEPFGVAELFRQGLESAQAYDRQRDSASGRLSLAVVGMLGLVGVLGLLAALLYMVRPSLELSALENQIRRVLPGGSAADRLREPLEDRLKELELIQASSSYDQVPPKMRDEVVQARQEIELYQRYHKDFNAQVSDPRYATREDELDQIEKNLRVFTLPQEYDASWSDTKLGRRLQEWRLNVQSLREASKDEVAWMLQQVDEGQKLHKQVVAKGLPAEERDAWFKAVQSFLDREVRHKRTERVAPAATLTYDHVYKLQRVEQARKEWDRAKDRLKDLRKAVQ